MLYYEYLLVINDTACCMRTYNQKKVYCMFQKSYKIFQNKVQGHLMK